MFNWVKFQESLLAFQNQEQVESFEYYDKKNRARVQEIRTCIIEQKDNLETVIDTMTAVKEEVLEHEDTLIDYEQFFIKQQIMERNKSIKDVFQRLKTKFAYKHWLRQDAMLFGKKKDKNKKKKKP